MDILGIVILGYEEQRRPLAVSRQAPLIFDLCSNLHIWESRPSIQRREQSFLSSPDPGNYEATLTGLLTGPLLCPIFNTRAPSRVDDEATSAIMEAQSLKLSRLGS